MRMRRHLAAFVALALALPPLPASAQRYDSTPPTRVSLGAAAGSGVNVVVDYGARCDELTAYDGAMTAGSGVLTSAGGSFKAADVGKIAVVVNAGTIQSFSSAVISAPGTGYAPGDTDTLTGGTETANAAVLVATTKVVAATLNAGGSGGSDGTQTVTGATTGATYSVTVSGGTITAVLSVLTGGSYKVVGSVPASESVTGAGLSGAVLNTTMGANAVVGAGGRYTVVPANPVAQGSSSGAGTGLTLTVTWMGGALLSTIASYQSATQVTLAANASASVANARYAYGTDDTAAFNTALASAPLSTTGGTLAVPGMCLLSGALAPPYAGSAPPKQPPLHIAGAGRAWDGLLTANTALGGAGLDLLYDGTDTLHPAKIDTRGSGTLEIDHLTVRDTNSDNFLFLQTTNTTLNLHDNNFEGNPACSGENCTQNILQFGGITNSSSALGGILPTNGFQGYGTQIVNNGFSHCKTAFTFGGSANAIHGRNNTIDLSCGSADPTGAPYQFLGAGLGTGGNDLGGIAEVTHYPYAAAMTSIGATNEFNNLTLSVWDAGVPSFGGFYFSDTNSVFNKINPAFISQVLQPTAIAGAGASNNTYIGAGSAETTQFKTGIKLTGLLSGGSLFTDASGLVTARSATGTGNAVLSQSPTILTPIFGSGAGSTKITINGGSSAANGAYIDFQSASADAGYIGHASAILGGAFSSDLLIYAPASHAVRFNAGNSQIASFAATGLSLPGATSGTTILAPAAVASGTLTLPAATDTLVGKATTDTLTNKTLTDPIIQEFVVSTGTLTATSNTVLATIPGLSIALTAGKTYNCSGHLTVTASAATGGISVALVATNSLTATSASFTASNFNGVTNNARSTVTALGSTMASANQVTDVYLDGAIVVNVAGTINVQAAQQTSNATSTVVGLNSTFRCVRTN